MPSISVIMPTARDEHPIVGMPNLRFLEPTLKSLKNQTFTDFEFIIVDALYDERSYDFSKLSFPVKHVPIDPRHRFWLDRGRWGVCGQLNTALLHAEGELIVRVDDCSEFDEEFLARFWGAYESGLWALAMHIRFLKGKPARLNEEYLAEGYEAKHAETWDGGVDRGALLKKLYGEDGLIRDSRYDIVKANGGKMIGPYNWMYGYSSFTLEAALNVNGFDEMFDGDKSLEDVDFGSRLEMAGYQDMFSLDVKHQCIEHEHKPIPERLIPSGQKAIKCNYAVMMNNRQKKAYRANDRSLTSSDITYIKEETLRPPCSPHSGMYENDCEGELFNLWASNQSIFDLRGERLEI